MRSFFVLSALIVFAASDLLHVGDLNTIVKLINQHRSETEETLKPIHLSQHLTDMADEWIGKCTLERDSNLQHLSVLFNTEMPLITEDLINNVVVFQQGRIQEFQPYELFNAPNWAALMSDQATEVGCSLAKCGEIYSFGCLLNSKPILAGHMPYTSTCKPEKQHAVDCEQVGNCGTYYDGCFKVVCGPICRNETNQARSERTDHPQRKIVTHTRVRVGGMAETDKEELMKRGPGGYQITSNNNDNYLIGQYQQSIISPNGRNILVMQSDGNLVLYDTGSNNLPMWYTATGQGRVVYYALIMQGDGNLVVYDVSTTNWVWKWYSHTQGQGNAPFYLTITNYGNLILTYAPAGIYQGGLSWQTNTANANPTPPPPAPSNGGAMRLARNARDEIAA